MRRSSAKPKRSRGQKREMTSKNCSKWIKNGVFEHVPLVALLFCLCDIVLWLEASRLSAMSKQKEEHFKKRTRRGCFFSRRSKRPRGRRRPLAAPSARQVDSRVPKIRVSRIAPNMFQATAESVLRAMPGCEGLG